MKVSLNNLKKKAEKFCEKLADILETDEVKIVDALKDFKQWDSLSVLSIIAMIDSEYGITVFAKEVMKLKTVKDLFSYIQKKSSLLT